MHIANINDHAMYYEVHGSGDPVLVMGDGELTVTAVSAIWRVA